MSFQPWQLTNIARYSSCNRTEALIYNSQLLLLQLKSRFQDLKLHTLQLMISSQSSINLYPFKINFEVYSRLIRHEKRESGSSVELPRKILKISMILWSLSTVETNFRTAQMSFWMTETFFWPSESRQLTSKKTYLISAHEDYQVVINNWSSSYFTLEDTGITKRRTLRRFFSHYLLHYLSKFLIQKQKELLNN